VLEVHDVVVRYGSIEALHGISFEITAGRDRDAARRQRRPESRRTLRMLSGLRAPVSGSVTFEGRDITQVKAHEFARDGHSARSEGRRIFPVMTVQRTSRWARSHVRVRLSDDLEEIYATFPF